MLRRIISHRTYPPNRSSSLISLQPEPSSPGGGVHNGVFLILLFLGTATQTRSVRLFVYFTCCTVITVQTNLRPSKLERELESGDTREVSYAHTRAPCHGVGERYWILSAHLCCSCPAIACHPTLYTTEESSIPAPYVRAVSVSVCVVLGIEVLNFN